MPFLRTGNVFNDRRILIATVVVFVVVFVTIIGLIIYFYATKNNKENEGKTAGDTSSTSSPITTSSSSPRTTRSSPNAGATTGAAMDAGQAVSLYQQWYDGDGTYYWSEGEGTCQISKTNLPPAARNSKFLVALNSEQFMNSAACGMCFRLKAEGKGLGSDPIKGDFIVFVKDLCPECKAGDIDLAEYGDGRWDISIQAVQCPVGNTFIQYWLQGSNPFYLKLQVRNTRVPCNKVEVQDKNGQWTQMKLSKDGHWEGSAVFNPAGDLPVRLTSITGAVVNDIIPKLDNQVVMEGKLNVQFPLVASLPNA